MLDENGDRRYRSFSESKTAIAIGKGH